MKRGLALASVLAAACSTTTSAVPMEGPATATASPSVAAPSVAGTWSSPSCGSRTYERRLTFDAGGTFSAEDRLSPCPPRVSCVWSGIVYRRGTYAASGDGTVTLSSDAARSRAQPLPATLVMEMDGGELVEVSPEGDRCVYARVGP